MLRPHRFRPGARIEVGDRLREAAIEAVQQISGAWLRHAGGSAVRADRHVPVRDESGARSHVPHHHLRLGGRRDVVCGDDVTVCRGVGGVRRNRRESSRAVGVFQDVRRVTEEGGGHRPAAGGLAGGWFGHGPDVGRDEGKRRLAAVVDIRSDHHKVRVVTKLWVVRDVAAGRGCVTAPAPCQVARVRGFRPSEKQVVVRQRRVEGDRRVEPAVALWIPLDLRVAGRQAGRHGREGPKVGRAQQGQVAPIVDGDDLIDELHVAGGADRPGGVGRRGLVSLVRGGQPGAVEPVVEGRRRGGGRRGRGSARVRRSGGRLELCLPKRRGVHGEKWPGLGFDRLMRLARGKQDGLELAGRGHSAAGERTGGGGIARGGRPRCDRGEKRHTEREGDRRHPPRDPCSAHETLHAR